MTANRLIGPSRVQLRENTRISLGPRFYPEKMAGLDKAGVERSRKSSKRGGIVKKKLRFCLDGAGRTRRKKQKEFVERHCS